MVYVTASAMVVVVLWVSPLFRAEAERYYVLAALDHGEIATITRGGGDELNDGLVAFSEGRYTAAIELLEAHLQENEEGSQVPYVRYVLGLAYLHVAKSNFLGRAHHVDRGKLDRGLEHLAEAARSTDSQRIHEDARWFQAKAHLMRLDAATALEELERIEAMNGRRASEARTLMGEIRALP